MLRCHAGNIIITLGAMAPPNHPLSHASRQPKGLLTNPSNIRPHPKHNTARAGRAAFEGAPNY